MAYDLADFQAESIARGYTRDFAFDLRSVSAEIPSELRDGEDPAPTAMIHPAES